eukprot:9985816-Lingulodinium_polyedra.AAC.1
MANPAAWAASAPPLPPPSTAPSGVSSGNRVPVSTLPGDPRAAAAGREARAAQRAGSRGDRPAPPAA